MPGTGVGRPRTRPDRVLADKAYTSRRNRRYLRRRGIPHTIPERLDQQRHRKNRGSRGGRPTGFDSERYKKRNTVERTINRLKGFRALATRYEKRAYIYLGTVTLAALVIWLRARSEKQCLGSGARYGRPRLVQLADRCRVVTVWPPGRPAGRLESAARQVSAPVRPLLPHPLDVRHDR